MGKKIKLLKDHAQILAHFVDIVRVALDVLALDHDAALVDLFQAVDGTQQRGLAGT